MTTATRDDVGAAQTALLGGLARIEIQSPHGTIVAFRFRPLVDGAQNSWDGRAWWLWRGAEYVGIVRRVGPRLELHRTTRSTTDRVIGKAAQMLLAGLGDERDDVAERGYLIRVAPRKVRS